MPEQETTAAGPDPRATMQLVLGFVRLQRYVAMLQAAIEAAAPNSVSSALALVETEAPLRESDLSGDPVLAVRALGRGVERAAAELNELVERYAAGR